MYSLVFSFFFEDDTVYTQINKQKSDTYKIILCKLFRKSNKRSRPREIIF